MRRSWFFTAVAILSLLCIAASIVAIRKQRPAPAPIQPVVEVPAPLTAAPPPDAPADPVLDLFNPSQDALSEQLNASALKNRLEELTVLAFVLRRCELISTPEYNDTFNTMGIYIQHMQPGEWQQTITTAVESASASYALLYAHSPCDSPSLPASAAALSQWRAKLNPPPR